MISLKRKKKLHLKRNLSSFHPLQVEISLKATFSSEFFFQKINSKSAHDFKMLYIAVMKESEAMLAMVGKAGYQGYISKKEK